MPTRVIIPPASEPITLAEAKAHLRVDHTDDDAVIGALISAARFHLEDLTERAFVTQTRELVLDAFSIWAFEIPGSVQSIVSLVYDDTSGAEQTVAPNNYVLDAISNPARLSPASGFYWPSSRYVSGSVRLTYVAGYGGPEAVPPPLKQAIKLLVGHWYSVREAAVDRAPTDIPFGVIALVSPYRAWL